MNRVTAAAAARLFTALLGDEPAPDHVPAPAGLPGGYPVLAGGMRVELDLRWPVEEAIAVNEAGGRFDGVERIDADGTVTLTDGDGRHAQARARLRRAGAAPVRGRRGGRGAEAMLRAPRGRPVGRVP